LIEDLVYANRILSDQGVVDAFGHVSARDDKDPDRFLLARSVAPALVTKADILEFDRNGEPIEARAAPRILSASSMRRSTAPGGRESDRS